MRRGAGKRLALVKAFVVAEKEGSEMRADEPNVQGLRSGHTPRPGWIVFGALAGAVLLGGGGYLAAWLFPPMRAVYFWMIVGGAPGLVVGGLLGSRVLGMAPRARIALGAIEGAVLLATVGGFGFLFLGLASPEGAFHGLRNFTLGAIVGGIAGIVLGGVLGSRPSTDDRVVR